MPGAEADRALGTSPACTFNRSPEADPIFWAGEDAAGALKLNGVIIALEASAAAGEAGRSWAADGLTVAVDLLGEEADWRSNAELVFSLERGLEVGYRGFWSCASRGNSS